MSEAGIVQIRQDQLWVDGVAQPQLYGAELQYFRLRGGSGRNVPRDVVIGLWKQALDRMVEARMNAISFYIPWDFHEYAEGKFDFNGTADEDGDGNADYPSRDVLTFFRMIQERGIKHIMARPGPYINAEWGFLGFGAVPLWFHEKYPDSHARNPKGQRTTLYSYFDPDLLRHTRLWFQSLHRQVLGRHIGPGRPVSFIQVDNETNLMWQSAYNHDYGSRAVRRYQEILKAAYDSIGRLNLAHSSQWASWSEIRPPARPGRNVTEDQDWYRFQDQAMFEYLRSIRSIWTELGVTEPSVLFTLAESYNAAGDGILPHYRLRNSPEVGMMTVNLYPKTYETGDRTLMNLPFKADHDVKAAETATDHYLGRREAWVLGPEIQGGWWKGIEVTANSRRQTYLTTIGHGLKALFIYYFNEGDNWQGDWMRNAVAPFHAELRGEERFRNIPDESLPDEFWRELDARVADRLLAVDTRGAWRNGGTQPETLYFDAAVGADGNARAPFALLKEIGEKIVQPYGALLGKAHELEDPVCVIKDSEAHAPSGVPGVQSRIVQSDWTGGLLALLMHAGANPRIHHWGLSPVAELLDPTQCRLLVYQDTGFATPALVETLAQAVDRGSSVVSFIHTGLVEAIRARRPQAACSSIPTAPMNVEGYRCTIGIGTLYHARVPIYDVFNTDFYHQIHDAGERRGVMDRILFESGIVPHVRIAGGGDRTVAFARSSADNRELWITAKTSRRDGNSGRIIWSGADPTRVYLVSDVLGGRQVSIQGSDLARSGFAFSLGESGSTAFHVRPAPSARRGR